MTVLLLRSTVLVLGADDAGATRMAGVGTVIGRLNLLQAMAGGGGGPVGGSVGQEVEGSG